MFQELTVLSATAASIGFLHTLLGPDHYMPFVAMSRAQKWSGLKTTWITFLCGLAHVLSSFVLGFLGIILGIGAGKLQIIESVRGNIAAWGLIAFGLIYFVWGLRAAVRGKAHSHWHAHADGTTHSHDHTHSREHVHVHPEEKTTLTPWILFTIFVFGPCEALIPILMYPAAKHNILGTLWVGGIFGVTTILTMLALVLIASRISVHVPVRDLNRFSHAFAGIAIFFCGAAIQFLGLP